MLLIIFALHLRLSAAWPHRRSNVQALDVLGQLDGAALSELQEALRQPPDQYWGERSSLAWN